MRILYFNLLLLLLVLVSSCKTDPARPSSRRNVRDLPQIIEQGKLIAITDYNSTNYFVYRGHPMGFHYELLKLFADHMGVKLEIGISTDLDKTFSCLIDRGCDILALDLTITRERSEMFDFTSPIIKTSQVLVQRKPTGWQQMNSNSIDQGLLKSSLDFSGITIHVQKNSSFVNRLKNLRDETGTDFNIIERSLLG